MKFLAYAIVVSLLSLSANAELQSPVVLNHEPTAVIVVPDNPQPIAVYAAEEFVHHIALSTGITLPIVEESQSQGMKHGRVYIGATQAARDAGIDVTALPAEGCVIDGTAGALYIAGNDGPGDPLSTNNVHSGTLWGVYQFLEYNVGVRWLWPGELGTYVPKRATIGYTKTREDVTPRFVQRNLRPSISPNNAGTGDERLAFSQPERERYAHDQQVFLRRHRMGVSENTFYSERSFGRGHAFEGWWEKYGADHPEWFQLNPDGTRGPANPARPKKVTMCVSNPELAAKVVELWKEERAKNPDQPLNIGVGESDDSAMCQCPNCLAWDDPMPDLSTLPAGLERSFEPVQAGARYARFAKTVQTLAAETDPDVQVHFYAYLNYFWAPKTFEPGPNVVIGFVPWFRWAGWFPRTDAEQAWIKEQWLGWQKAGVTMCYRPNWFLDGYTMPHVFLHQFADAFQFYAAHGMIATDFDSLQGMWGAQGPNLYVLARLQTVPDMPIEHVLDEYFSAYGPAADDVRDYFDYWEDYSKANRENAADYIRTHDDGVFRRYAKYAQCADTLYPLAVFPPAFALLDKAAATVEPDSEFAARIAFHRTGLEHAQRCVEAAIVVNDPNSSAEARAQALANLAAYRRTIEATGIANMDRAARIETESWSPLSGFDSDWGK